MRNCLTVALLTLTLLLSGCVTTPTVQSGAIDDVTYQQKKIQEARDLGTYLTAEELEDLKVPDDFFMKEQQRLVSLLIPQVALDLELEQMDFGAQSRFSSAIQWFESRYDPLSADFNLLSTHCDYLYASGRIRDAFVCAMILEKRLYHFIRSGAAEEFTASQRALEAASFLPIVNLVLPEDDNTEFVYKWYTVTRIKVSYFLAIQDFENAKKHARGLVVLGKAIWKNRPLLANVVPDGGVFHFVGEAELAKVLAHGDEKERKEAFEIANRLAAAEFENRLDAISVYFALGDYQRAKEVVVDSDEYNRKMDMINTTLLVALTGLQIANDPTFGIVHAAAASAAASAAAKYESEVYKSAERITAGFRESKIAYETDEIEKARKGYEALLEIPLIVEWTDILSTIHHDLAKLEMQTGNDAKVVEHLHAAIDIIESRRANFTLETERIGFVGDKQAIYADLVATLARQGRHTQAWEVAERAKARTLVELLAGQVHFASASSQDDSQIEEYLEELDRDEWGGVDLAYYRDLIATQEGIATRAAPPRGLARIAEKIRKVDPGTAALVDVDPPSAEQLQQLIDSDETLVEYFGVGDRYFIIVADAERVRVIPIDARDLEADVQAFRTAVQDPTGAARGLQRATQSTPDAALETVGRRLAKRLWDPIAKYIRSERVTIVPHGPLHYLPFSALPLSDGRRLIDGYSPRLLPSASVLTYLSDQPQHGEGVLVLGNPDLGVPELDLPYAQQEANALGKSLQDSRVLLRGDATETSVKRFGNDFARVHLASHGVFDPEQPLQSGLLLARDDENDGKLTVAELYQTRLDADLVVLSACETGLGKVSSGDDVVGFTRGFLYSGARSIVSSLWKVDDQATGELMQRFYARLEQHGDKRRALREAQRELRKAGYDHPYYWAAFNVIGETKGHI